MAGIVIFCMNNLQMGFYGSEGAAGFLWFPDMNGLPGFLWFSNLKGLQGFFRFPDLKGLPGLSCFPDLSCRGFSGFPDLKRLPGLPKQQRTISIGFAVPHGGEGSWQNLKHLDMDAAGETW